jgi:hypothetical protein
VWRGLANVLGYTVSDDWIKWAPNEHADYLQLENEPFACAVWNRNRPQIDSCVRLLFNAHQFMAKRLTHDNPELLRTAESPVYNGIQYFDGYAHGQAVFDDWDNVTNAIFRICDAINVLNKILVFQNPITREMREKPGMRRYWPTSARVQDSKPAVVTIDHFEEIYPLSALPFITSPPATNRVIIKTPEEVLTSQIISDWKPPREPDEYESWLEAAINEAKRKLKQVARMINNLRSLVPFSLGGEPDNEPKKPNE